MDFVILALFFLGIAMGGFGFLRLLVVAFRANLLWFIACIVLPGAAILFSITHWEESKSPVGTLGVGLAIWVAAAVMSRLVVA